MISAVKFCLFLLSITGYVVFITKKYQIKIEFVPALLCAWASCILFIGGLLNVLPYAAQLLLGGGYVLLAVSLRRRLAFDKREMQFYAAFVLVLFYFYYLLQGAHYTSYDNFSHWAAVVKDMLLTDRMPNFEDAVIRFQSYPLGSSLFIYAVCKFIGNADSCLLWAQLLMLLSFLFCFCVFIRKQNWYRMFLLFLYSVWTLTVNNSIYELRVDTLLPAAAAAAFVVIYVYKNEPHKAVCCSTGMFILLLNIKNSGVFFYAVCVLVLTVYARSYARRHKIWFGTAAYVLPLLSMFLWKRHVALVFSEGMHTKHAMSLENYEQMLAKKSMSDIVQIGGKMAGRFLSLESVEVQLLLFILLFAALLLRRQPLRRTAGMLALNLGCLVCYTVSLFAMYVFSMPLGEAQHLASYDRYMSSVLIFLYGITVVYLMDAESRAGQAKADAWAVAVLFLALCPLWQGRERMSGLWQVPDYAHTSRCQFQKMVERDGLETGKAYIIYCSGSDDYARYLFYLSRYELWTGSILVVGEDDFVRDTVKNKIKMKDINEADYDYLIVWDFDETIGQYLAERRITDYEGMERFGVKTCVYRAG